MREEGRVALVTGASGFTGHHLVPVLQAQGYRVVGVGRGRSVADEDIACDLTDAKAVQAVVAHVQPTHVVHLAGLAFVAHGDARAFYDVNLFGTLHLLEALCALSEVPRRVLVASSANVYGVPGIERIAEGVCPAPVNHYACSKLAMEHMVRSEFARLSVVITRPFNYTGLEQDERFLIPKIVSHFKRKASVIELGNLDVAREFADVRDVVDAYVRLLEVNGGAGECVNICSGRAYGLGEVLALCEVLTEYRMEVQVNPAFVRANELPRLAGDPGKLVRMIGPRSLRSLADTLRWMLDV